MRHSYRWFLVVLIFACLSLSACSRTSEAKAKPKPAQVEAIQGTDLHRVVLTQRAAERLDLQAVAVREEPVTRTRRVGGEVVTTPAAAASTAPRDRAWVRVLLNDTDMQAVDMSQAAQVRRLSGDSQATGVKAQAAPLAAASAAKDANATLYYVVDTAGHGLAPGQRVSVELTLAGSGAQRKIIPYSAVIYDLHGEAWVYTNPEPLVFVRHPIDVDYIEGDLAILVAGPPAGARVVAVGAAELFGAESGVGGSGH